MPRKDSIVARRCYCWPEGRLRHFDQNDTRSRDETARYCPAAARLGARRARLGNPPRFALKAALRGKAAGHPFPERAQAQTNLPSVGLKFSRPRLLPHQTYRRVRRRANSRVPGDFSRDADIRGYTRAAYTLDNGSHCSGEKFLLLADFQRLSTSLQNLLQ